MILSFSRYMLVGCLLATAVFGCGSVAAADAVAVPPSPAGIEVDSEKLVNAANDAAVKAASAQETRAAEMERMKQGVFEGVMASMMPLSNDQIRTYMQRLESVQEATIAPSYGQPKGEIKIQTVSIDPGAQPPQINLVPGYITTVTFVDASGQPWPIADIGIAGNFEVKPTDKGSHVVRIVPLVQKGVGNLSVMLKDFPIPVIFRLWSGGPNLHWRYDARIPKYGPNAKLPLIDKRRLSAGDEAIMMFLDNAPPQGAKRLKVAGIDGRTMAWMADGKVYVRTPLTMLSPTWEASVASADGMTVYQVGDAPVLLLSDAGMMVRARLSRGVDDDK
jgi:intracellular multiplication protein IcmK